jgi:hypothetical protein
MARYEMKGRPLAVESVWGCWGTYTHMSIPHTKTMSHAEFQTSSEHLSNSHASISFPTSARTNWTS